LYYLFRQYRHTGQHLFHLDWLYYHEKRPKKDAFGADFQQKLVALEEIKPLSTPIMQDLSPERSRTTHLFERGNWLVPGEVVTPGVPEILGKLPEGAPNNRLGMAQWIVSEDNPLTARVTVNRFWEQLFGYGIVE